MAVTAAYKKWFEKNKAKLNEERRLKYKQDSEYRAKVQAQSRATKVKARNRVHFKSTVAHIYGKVYDVFPIQYLLKIHNLDAWDVTKLQRRGYIPPTLLNNKVKVVTQRQVDLFSWLLQHKDSKTPKEVFDYLITKGYEDDH